MSQPLNLNLSRPEYAELLALISAAGHAEAPALQLRLLAVIARQLQRIAEAYEEAHQ